MFAKSLYAWLIIALLVGIDSATAVGSTQANGLQADVAKTSQQISQTLSTAEWLGPLAPIALSPFFGLAMLSGIATYGPEWIQQRSAIFAPTSQLNNPWLFWTMATLTVFTSLPRLSKVSKPIAMAAEKAEAYSAIVILLALRLLATSEVPGVQSDAPAIATAGLMTMPLDVLMFLFAALNIIVINAVKVFFEFLIWLTPIPFIDACFEATNKSICAALAALYCFSPFLASVINLVAFALCALVFLRVSRMLRYYRHVIAGPVLALLFPKWFGADPQVLVGFLAEPWNGLPKLARVEVVAHDDVGRALRVRGKTLWRRAESAIEDYDVATESGLIIQKLVIQADPDHLISIYHRRLGDQERPDFVPKSIPTPAATRLSTDF